MTYIEPVGIIEGARMRVIRQPAIPDLTAKVGTTDGTVADVEAAYDQAVLNDNFRELTDTVNQILVTLRAAGLVEE